MRSFTFALGLAIALLSVTATVSGQSTIIWGNVVDGVRIGIEHDAEHFPGNGAINLYVQRMTNYANNLVMPELKQFCEFVLNPTNSEILKLTAEGSAFGERLRTTMSRSRRISRQIRFSGPEPIRVAGFYLDRCLTVHESNIFEIEVRLKLLKEVGRNLSPLLFEPIKLRLRLKANRAAMEGS